MKIFISLLLFLLSSFSFSQSIIRPGAEFESKWLTDRNWKMNMTMRANGNSRDLGVIHYAWIKDGVNYDIITDVILPGLPPKSWIDSLEISSKTLAPKRHKSTNMQRDILIEYAKSISGYYLDKRKNVSTPFTYDLDSPVFDSGFYFFLLQLLPLETLSTPSEIGIFDFKPEGNQGALKAFVTSVESGIYESPSGEKTEVWIVKSYDTIGRGEQTNSYISKSTRDILKQETLDKEGNGMVLERIWEEK
ncbi:MAG: hypothetical protein KGZ81_16310 [Flavobacteriales bacterium]|nr:hypothetical protein [Flavobacteriales bacterium]MBS4042153.1 hypothetical protein [Flavobacteriales bacterium]